jgi:hypothetical protein
MGWWLRQADKDIGWLRQTAVYSRLEMLASSAQQAK